MKDLERFASMDFIEQVTCLTGVAQNREHACIPEIVGLTEKISRNEAIGLVLRDTLKTLLSGSEEHAFHFLSSGNREIRTICIEVSGKQNYASTANKLLAIAEEARSTGELGVLFATISALSRLQLPEALDLIRDCMEHEDPLISSQCIEILGDLRDGASLPSLCEMISRADRESPSAECDLSTATAISALRKIGGRETVYFLVSKLHHSSPAARRLIHQQLAEMGADSIEPLAAVFQVGTVDQKIFAANILGHIGTREAAEVLVRALDKGLAEHPNIRFAIFEALGRTSGMTGLVALADGLAETDQLVLMAVICSLDVHLNPWIEDKIAEILGKGTDHSRAVVKAIVASRSMNIFEALFTREGPLGTLLINAIRESGDGELIGEFSSKLAGMDTEHALDAVQSIERIPGRSTGLRVLAVDDSKAMLNFYRSLASSMGLGICTAANGQEALDLLAGDGEFRLIITDMNMPVMDGIEFTRSVREDPERGGLPIIMVTTESERSQQELAKESGVTDFLQKPFSMETLQEKIRAYL